MADGDISRRLVAELRDELGDIISRKIPNDETLYQKLDRYQHEFMRKYKTTMDTEKFTFAADVTTYEIDSNFFKIIRIWMEQTVLDEWDEDELGGYYHRNDHSLIFTTDMPVGEDFYVDAYVRPVAADVISESVDPIIGLDYYPYLKDAVKSEYRDDKNRYFKRIEEINKDVKAMANTDRQASRMRTTAGNPIGILQF